MLIYHDLALLILCDGCDGYVIPSARQGTYRVHGTSATPCLWFANLAATNRKSDSRFK